MENLTDLLIVGFLMGYIVFSEVRNYFERKNLMDRLMSRNFTEFVTMDKERKVVAPKGKKELGIPI